MKHTSFCLVALMVLGIPTASAQKNGKAKPSTITPPSTQGVADSLLKPILNQVNFRMIGPSTTSGRIVDIAVNPNNKAEYYLAAAYGGVWKTSNGGTTYEPIFDSYGTQDRKSTRLTPVTATSRIPSSA